MVTSSPEKGLILQAQCATSRVPESKFWRSLLRIQWNAANVVKAILSMPKVLLTQLFHAYVPSHQKTRSGMIESLRVLKVCRKTAVAARRVALQMIQMNIVSTPDELRDQIRHLTRMQLIRTLPRSGPTSPPVVTFRMLTVLR